MKPSKVNNFYSFFAGKWLNEFMEPNKLDKNRIQPLSTRHFAFVDTSSTRDNMLALQCIWCGVFMDSHELAQHFEEMHSSSVRVPKCNLCVQEMLINGKIKVNFAFIFQK